MKFKKSFLFSLLLSAGISNCYAQALPLNDINLMAQDFMTQNNVPGLAIDIYDNGQAHIATYGVMNKTTEAPVTKNTIFEIASMTKTFTATILALFINKGKIQLDDQIGPYLPANLRNSNLPIYSVTFKQLATHTASLPAIPSNYQKNQPYGDQQFFNFLENWQPSYAVGTQYRYSNVGFGVLGLALGEIANESYENLLNDLVLTPLGMTNTMMEVPASEQDQYAQGYFPNNRPAPRWPMTAWKPAAGALRSTPIDMMKFLEANLDVGQAPNDIKVAMQQAQQGYFEVNPQTIQGLAWVRSQLNNNQLVIYKNGTDYGFNSQICLLPDKKIGAVILANKNGTNIKAFCNSIVSLLSGSSS